MSEAVDAPSDTSRPTPALSRPARRTRSWRIIRPPRSTGPEGAVRTVRAVRTMRAVRTVRALRCLAWAASTAVLAVLAAVLAGGEHDVAVVLLAALDGWAVPGVATAAVALAVLRRLGAPVLRPLVATALAAVLTATVLQPWPHGGGSTSTAGRFTALRVMALNVEFGGADAAQVMAEVRRTAPDVLVLTELTAPAVSALHDAGLDAALPYSKLAPRPSAFGTGVWSRTPLSGAERIEGLTFEGIRARIAVDGTPVVVFGVHPATPLGTPWWVRSPFWTDDYARLTQLVQQAVAAGDAVVLAGDLNASVHSGPLRRLLDTGLRDAGTATRWGWQGRSWPAGSPLPQLLRIDHVLATPTIGITGIDTFAVDGTDHHGVSAELQVPYRPAA